jgi:hypothetical protein
MSYKDHYVNCAEMNEDRTQSEAGGLSGRRGADEGHPTPTRTHLHGDLRCLQQLHEQQMSEMRFRLLQQQRDNELKQLQFQGELMVAMMGGYLTAALDPQVLEIEKCRR